MTQMECGVTDAPTWKCSVNRSQTKNKGFSREYGLAVFSSLLKIFHAEKF